LRRAELGQQADASPKGVVTEIASAISENPPRLYVTFDHLRDGLKRSKISSAALIAQIDAGRKAALRDKYDIEKKMEFPQGRPANWIRARS